MSRIGSRLRKLRDISLSNLHYEAWNPDHLDFRILTAKKYVHPQHYVYNRRLVEMLAYSNCLTQSKVNHVFQVFS